MISVERGPFTVTIERFKDRRLAARVGIAARIVVTEEIGGIELTIDNRTIRPGEDINTIFHNYLDTYITD